MAFYKIITTQGSAIYKEAPNKFQLLRWFKNIYSNELQMKSIIVVNQIDFKFPVEVVEPITGVQVCGNHTLSEIKAVIEPMLPGDHKSKIKDILAGKPIEFINRLQNTVLKINTLEPFPMIDTPYLERAMSC